MFMKKKFILGVLYLSAATAQCLPKSDVIGVFVFDRPSEETATIEPIGAMIAGDEGVVRVAGNAEDGITIRQVGVDGGWAVL